MNPQQLRIVPTSTDVTDRLKNRADYSAVPGTTPEVGDRLSGAFSTDITVVGACDMFDLSKDADRAEYAKLSAKLFSGTECIKLWEERSLINGVLTVYVSYINYMKVHQSSTQHIDLRNNNG